MDNGLSIRDHGRPRRYRGPIGQQQPDLGRAGQRIRQHLDSEWVLRAALDEIVSALVPTAAAVWLGGGHDAPRLCHSIGGAGEDEDVPDIVLAAARRWELVAGENGALAVPAFAPRSGVVAIFSVVGGPWPQPLLEFVEALAGEAGLAYEAAVVYERAVAEKEKSEAILAGVADGVVVTDRHGTLLQLNPAAENILHSSSSAALGRACHDILRLRDGEQVLDCSSGCALLADRGDRSANAPEIWRDHADGRPQPLLADAQAIRGPDGTVSEVVHTLRDITKLKEADEAKTLFLATTSHELKTPLTVIKGFAQTLLSQPNLDPTMHRHALSAIERRAVELHGIVDRLLLSSRIEAGRVDVQLRSVDVVPLLRERVEAIGAATHRDIGLTLDDDLPDAIADPESLATVIDHLLDNAIKYSPDGQVVTVATRASADAVEVAVADRGVGMDASDMERCFEKFWQAESTEIRRFGGTGIGLYIVRSLVEAMGGEVRVNSAPGEGTVFSVALRRAA